jgi:hypothetical protein
MVTQIITAERLRALVSYSPETGKFHWRIRTSNRIRIGDEAGSIRPTGYVSIGVDGHLYQAHRLAWLHVTGMWPTGVIDHLNHVIADNRWSNLRDVSQSVNLHNRLAAQPNSQTGLLGAFPFRSGYRAGVRDGGKSRHVGLFDTPEEAHSAYVAAKRRLHEGCTL